MKVSVNIAESRFTPVKPAIQWYSKGLYSVASVEQQSPVMAKNCDRTSMSPGPGGYFPLSAHL
jgi:hypothetical protein